MWEEVHVLHCRGEAVRQHAHSSAQAMPAVCAHGHVPDGGVQQPWPHVDTFSVRAPIARGMCSPTQTLHAELHVSTHDLQALPTVPVPEWNYGKPVSMDSLKKTTDAYMKALEPKRKLQLAAVPSQVSGAAGAGGLLHLHMLVGACMGCCMWYAGLG